MGPMTLSFIASRSSGVGGCRCEGLVHAYRRVSVGKCRRGFVGEGRLSFGCAAKANRIQEARGIAGESGEPFFVSSWKRRLHSVWNLGRFSGEIRQSCQNRSIPKRREEKFDVVVFSLNIGSRDLRTGVFVRVSCSCR